MMSFASTKQIFTLLTVGIGLIIAAPQGIAEEQSSTLSGRVINIKGEPIAGAPIALLYVKIVKDGGADILYNRSLYPFLRQRPAHFPQELRGKTSDEAKLQGHPPFLESKTDSEGRFTFTGIATQMAQLMVLPMENDTAPPTPQNLKSVPEIQTVKFGEVTFHPHDFSFFRPIGAVTFAIKPGVSIENVEVKVRTEEPPKIQGRLVFKNGEPLAGAVIEINIGRLNSDSGIGSAYSRSLHTDADGNFVSAISGLGTYVLSVNHRRLSAMSELFIVEADKPHEKVVLTLNGNSVNLSELPPESPEEQRYGVSDIPGVWIVNPENGHAYKWIACNDWEDAQAKAADEEAHLVTITSEAEQIWLEGVFGPGPYWIGLTDVLEEGEWIWETGEPVTYTNWGEEEEDILDEPPALFKAFGAKGDRQRRRANEEDYVIMSARWGEEIGKWHPADLKTAHRRGRVRMAILEKDGMRSKVHGLSLPDITPEN